MSENFIRNVLFTDYYGTFIYTLFSYYNKDYSQNPDFANLEKSTKLREATEKSITELNDICDRLKPFELKQFIQNQKENIKTEPKIPNSDSFFSDTSYHINQYKSFVNNMDFSDYVEGKKVMNNSVSLETEKAADIDRITTSPIAGNLKLNFNLKKGNNGITKETIYHFFGNALNLGILFTSDTDVAKFIQANFEGFDSIKFETILRQINLYKNSKGKDKLPPLKHFKLITN